VYFQSRPEHEHNVRNTQQLIALVAYTMGENSSRDGFDPAQYIAAKIDAVQTNTQMDLKKQAEQQYALEILASALGIKDAVMQSLFTRDFSSINSPTTVKESTRDKEEAAFPLHPPARYAQVTQNPRPRPSMPAVQVTTDSAERHHPPTHTGDTLL
jgi:hypothetical protein